MAVLMRIIQRFDVSRDNEFMELEKLFTELEKRRPDYPRGRRLRPISGSEPCNSLIWECEFPSLDAAQAALDFFTETQSMRRCLRSSVNTLSRSE